MKTVNMLPVLLILLLSIGALPAAAQQDFLSQGIEQYKQENFEESVELLVQARKQNPEDSTAAFFLGLAYKQIMDYPKAVTHLKDAVRLTPRIKEALVELVDVLSRMPDAKSQQEAWVWIDVAEKEDVLPAKIAFLKGMLLQKQDDHAAAVQEFEKAKSLDPELSQPADFRIAMSYMRENKLAAAKEKFQVAILQNPQTNLADFARQYQDVVEQRIELERPLHVTVGVYGQYNSNVVFKPSDGAAAGAITNESSYQTIAALRLDYTPRLQGSWLFNAQYSFSGVFNQRNVTTHDALINSLYVAPGYQFGNLAVNLAAQYQHVMVRNPDYETYSDYVSIGPMARYVVNKTNMLELFAGGDYYDYHRKPLSPDDDRDSDAFRGYFSWYWSYMPSGLLNLRYEYADTNTDGNWWENDAHRFSLTVNYPILEDLSLQTSAQARLVDYKKKHVLLGNLDEREDDIYQITAGLTYQFNKNIRVIGQYSHTNADSNIVFYEYDVDIYSLGVEYRY